MASPAKSRDSTVAVLVIPPSLTFYTNDVKTHQQVFTIYNLNDFPVKYAVTSTTPQKYHIPNDVGVVDGKDYKNIDITIKEVFLKNEGVIDKFRVNLYDRKDFLGHKDVTAQLLPGRSKTLEEGSDKFRSMSPQQTSTCQSTDRDITLSAQSRGPGLGLIMTCMILLLVLCLPNQGDTESSLPMYLHLSVNNKVFIGIIFGVLMTLMVQNANR
ncbi:motile sperm domain-containing protein 1-like [Pomacea canaliculata]|uniref:motile sperm domain-containing protein 1-like n=1 Tax=Pomacea canaliculata TaxID=400727 RepID=UPI000D72A4C9|nr:motile sperm domain-containing protein 1-like [Pomacea canaliculata]XP_025079421.1 motile sperm domain-containing protein 1-like [Pomacea canaliculata]